MTPNRRLASVSIEQAAVRTELVIQIKRATIRALNLFLHMDPRSFLVAPNTLQVPKKHMVTPNGNFDVNITSKVQAFIGNMLATVSNGRVSDWIIFTAFTTVEHVTNLTSDLDESKVKTSWNISVPNRGNSAVFLIGSAGDSYIEAALLN